MATYPKTPRTSWRRAEERWKKLSAVDRLDALHGARELAEKPPDPQFRKAADSWLLDRRWETVGDNERPKDNRVEWNGYMGTPTEIENIRAALGK